MVLGHCFVYFSALQEGIVSLAVTVSWAVFLAVVSAVWLAVALGSGEVQGRLLERAAGNCS